MAARRETLMGDLAGITQRDRRPRTETDSATLLGAEFLGPCSGHHTCSQEPPSAPSQRPLLLELRVQGRPSGLLMVGTVGAEGRGGLAVQACRQLRPSLVSAPDEIVFHPAPKFTKKGPAR